MQAILTKAIGPVDLLLSFQKSPYHFFDKIKPDDPRQIRHMRLGFKEFYFCYHPDHAKHILHDFKKNYPKSSLVLNKILPLSGPTGLIQLSDKAALPVRQAAGRMMTPDCLKRLSECVKNFVAEKYPEFDQAATENSVVDLKPILTEIVLRTAGIFILNEDIQARAQKLNQAFIELNRLAGESLRSVVPNPYSSKRRRCLKIIHRELDQIIDEKLKTSESSLLQKLSKKNSPRSFLRDQVKAFMFAGYDTTASSLIFAVELVARNKQVQNRIQVESTLSHQEAFYTQAAYKESLRLYPSAYFLPRQTAAADVIDGQKIKAGAQVFISIKHIHRNPDFYEQPDKFIPDRFLEEQKHSHAFIPFGGGPRVCIGAALAIMEATVVLQKICARYHLIPANNEPPEIEGLITAHTKSPLLVRFIRREHACTP